MEIILKKNSQKDSRDTQSLNVSYLYFALCELPYVFVFPQIHKLKLWLQCEDVWRCTMFEDVLSKVIVKVKQRQGRRPWCQMISVFKRRNTGELLYPLFPCAHCKETPQENKKSRKSSINTALPHTNTASTFILDFQPLKP